MPALAAQQDIQLPELEVIANGLASENNSLVDALQELEQIGNKLKDTSVPMKPEAKETAMPNGKLEEMRIQIGLYSLHNDKLRELVRKFRQLI